MTAGVARDGVWWNNSAGKAQDRVTGPVARRFGYAANMLERLQEDVERRREDACRLASGGTSLVRPKPPTVGVPTQEPAYRTCGGRLVPRCQGGVVNAVCFGCGAEYGELPEAAAVNVPQGRPVPSKSAVPMALTLVLSMFLTPQLGLLAILLVGVFRHRCPNHPNPMTDTFVGWLIGTAIFVEQWYPALPAGARSGPRCR